MSFFSYTSILLVLMLSYPLSAEDPLAEDLNPEHHQMPGDTLIRFTPSGEPVHVIYGEPYRDYPNKDELVEKDEDETKAEKSKWTLNKLGGLFAKIFAWEKGNSTLRTVAKKLWERITTVEYTPFSFLMTVAAVSVGTSEPVRELYRRIRAGIANFGRQIVDYFSLDKDKKDYDRRVPVYYAKQKRSAAVDPIVENIADMISDVTAHALDMVEELFF